MQIKLYAHPFSSYCQKALIAFYEKDIAFEMQLLGPENPAALREHQKLWPIGRFPVVAVGADVLVEASIIIEWLDVQFPATPRLVPQDQRVALDVRMRDRIFDNYVMTPMQKIVFDRIRNDAVRDAHGVGEAHAMLDKAYKWLNSEMASRTWAAGDTFSMADCAAAPSLFYANWVHPLSQWKHLLAYLNRLIQRRSVARAIDEAHPYRHLFPGGAPADDQI